ncbi:hexokinase family protein [Verticillium dahliae]
MTMSSDTRLSLQDFLQPLHVDLDTIHSLSKAFYHNFIHLAADDLAQFLPTPISESILKPVSKSGHGRHLAIDIGGSNLRVGFIELSPEEAVSREGGHGHTNGASNGVSNAATRVARLKEQSWPIAEHLKSMNDTKLFDWIGECIAAVVTEGCRAWAFAADEPIPLGITFSFPMVQRSLNEASIIAMGKGFAIHGDVELGSLLLTGYNKSRRELPPIRIAAIANDSVSTLVSFNYLYGEDSRKKAAMGLIVGTGCNATIPLKLAALHESKRPARISLLPGEAPEQVRIAVNTEWSIKGSAPPLQKLGLITRWDEALDAAGEMPGFQPLEYMTAGRYLGELGRLMLLDYLDSRLGVDASALPSALLTRHGMTTTFLSHFRPLDPDALVSQLETEFPTKAPFRWTTDMATALYHMSKAIEVRAAGIVSAAVVALLRMAGDVPEAGDGSGAEEEEPRELGVGYTGGCIAHFQDYLHDTQRFLDELVAKDVGDKPPVRIVLSPCHDGGIKGAGILAAAAESSLDRET